MKKNLLTAFCFICLSFSYNSLHAQLAPGSPSEPDTSEIALGSRISNYPNPVVNSTVITYNVRESGFITVNIYKTTGQKIANVFTGFKKAGSYTSEFSADNVSYGIYVCTLSYTSNNKQQLASEKMYVIK